MSYRDTARAFVRAETTDEAWSVQAHWLDSIRRGVPEHQATGYDPNWTARRYAEHVEKVAAELREALAEWARCGVFLDDDKTARSIRALLTAIGEGEGA